MARNTFTPPRLGQTAEVAIRPEFGVECEHRARAARFARLQKRVAVRKHRFGKRFADLLRFGGRANVGSLRIVSGIDGDRIEPRIEAGSNHALRVLPVAGHEHTGPYGCPRDRFGPAARGCRTVQLTRDVLEAVRDFNRSERPDVRSVGGEQLLGRNALHPFGFRTLMRNGNVVLTFPSSHGQLL